MCCPGVHMFPGAGASMPKIGAFNDVPVVGFQGCWVVFGAEKSAGSVVYVLFQVYGRWENNIHTF